MSPELQLCKSVIISNTASPEDIVKWWQLPEQHRINIFNKLKEIDSETKLIIKHFQTKLTKST